MTVAFIVFCMCYYLGGFSLWPIIAIPRWAGYAMSSRSPCPVIVVVNSDLDYIENRLPLLFGTGATKLRIRWWWYATPRRQIMLLRLLEELAAQQRPSLCLTVIPSDHKFHPRNKLGAPGEVGLEAAIYDNVMITSSEAAPVSTEWLSMMSYGFPARIMGVGKRIYSRTPQDVPAGFFNGCSSAINMHESLMMCSRAP